MRGRKGHKEEGQKKGRTSERATHKMRRKGDHKTCTGANPPQGTIRERRARKQAKGEGAPNR